MSDLHKFLQEWLDAATGKDGVRVSLPVKEDGNGND